MRTREWEEGAIRVLVDRWFYALEDDEAGVAEGLRAWFMGPPNVSGHQAKGGLKGEIDHIGAEGFLRGLLSLLPQAGRKGMRRSTAPAP